MAQNVAVVALFENAQAAAAVEELTQRGFRRDQVELTTSQSAGGSRDALHGHLSGLGAPAREAQFWTQGVHGGGGTLLSLHTSEDRVEEAREILNRLGARSPDDMDAADDTVAHTGTTAATAATTGGQTDKTVIPIVEEQLTVGKRQVEGGGVRVLTRVTETPVQEQVTLREENVTVERRPVDRALSEADRANLVGQSDRTIEVTETAEQAVVSKQARVVEEVVVGKESSQRTETVQDSVRRTEVDVEELNTADRPVNTTAGTTTGTTVDSTTRRT